jgi:hypothetical protein
MYLHIGFLRLENMTSAECKERGGRGKNQCGTYGSPDKMIVEHDEEIDSAAGLERVVHQ